MRAALWTSCKTVSEFFFRKVANISVRSPRDSQLSGFFIKHRSSAKATPTSPTPAAVATAESDTPPPEPAVTSRDPAPVAAPVAAEVKGHVHEGVKHGSPQTGRHLGVQVLGDDMLAEIRAKQEKHKKAGVSPAAAATADPPDEERDHGHMTPAEQKDTQDEPAANKLKLTLQDRPRGRRH